MFQPRTWALCQVRAGWSHTERAARTEPAADPAGLPRTTPRRGSTASPAAVVACGSGIPMQLERQDLQARLRSFSSGCFSLVQLVPVPVRVQSCSAAIALGSDTAFKLPVPQTGDWLLFTRRRRSGSCTLIVASKQSELGATLLSTPQMLSKKTVATWLAQSSRCGMQWGMFLGKLGVLPCFTGVETGCGKGWCTSQRTCLLSPSPLCWTSLLSPPAI